jgi:hypothetical protein
VFAFFGTLAAVIPLRNLNFFFDIRKASIPVKERRKAKRKNRITTAKQAEGVAPSGTT